MTRVVFPKGNEEEVEKRMDDELKTLPWNGCFARVEHGSTQRRLGPEQRRRRSAAEKPEVGGECFKTKNFTTVKEFAKKIPDSLRLAGVIGEGFEGQVRSAVFRHKHAIAIKVVKRSRIPDELYRSLCEGIACWSKLKHPHVIRLLGEVRGENMVKWLMITPLSRYGNLEDILRKSACRLPTPRTIFWISQILKAVDYLHANDVAHRDLKLENCLYFDFDVIKVADFGFAKDISGGGGFGIFHGGTLQYMAPEVIDGTVCEFSKIDVWTIGVIAYRLLFRKFPFGGGNQYEVRSRQRRSRLADNPLFQMFFVDDYDLRPDVQTIMTTPQWKRLTVSPKTHDEILTEQIEHDEKVSRVDTLKPLSVTSQLSINGGEPRVQQSTDDSRSFDSLSSDHANGPSKTSAQRKVAVRRAVDVFVKSTVEKGVNNVVAEFFRIRKDVDKRELTAFKAANALGKNRFGDIGCLDCTRIVLHPNSDYIHANYVSSPRYRKRFICTQAPMETTTVDFWRMVVQEKVKIIIMLCDFFEENMSTSAVYFPVEKGNTLQFDNFEIINQEINEINVEEEHSLLTISVSVLHLKSAKGNQKVMHYFVRGWADRRVFSPRLICRLLTEVRSSDRPIVVHCSGGIGRSGTLIAIEIILEKLIAGDVAIDTERVVQQIRRQRACAISTEAQYLFIHRTVLHYLDVKKRLGKSMKSTVAKFVADYDRFILASQKQK
ncbi:hypothetical protein QR680_013500 [Steinernema hermaphroditum]|uniref:Protein kinase domain-containing protein n=1 Tax=Steinernema hermaphroditum TaxID=289476 RepID=A0AA39M2M2_9BILA|nr:hypothetical protein QR680_013500 [Steinernema hermaphroditum]